LFLKLKTIVANYINKPEFDSIMMECKQLNELTPKAIDMFSLLAREVSKSENGIFKSEADRQDCIQSAIGDFVQYWRSWKINPMCQLKMVRNFVNGEKIHIFIGDYSQTFTAKEFVSSPTDFQIVTSSKHTLPTKKNITISINKTLQNLYECIIDVEKVNVTCGITGEVKPITSPHLHKVTKKIGMSDNTCNTQSNSYVLISKVVGGKISLSDKSSSIGITRFGFDDPPPAFNYYTSLARNGIIKAIHVLYPKAVSIMTNFSDINRDNGGHFNF